MKRIILSLLVLAVACTVCWLVAYRLAYKAGFACAKELQLGTFAYSLGALQKLRTGDVPEATQRMEALCFSSAAMLYDDPAYRNVSLTKKFAPELIRYRATYRTNRTEWTPTEERLDRVLADWK